MLSRSARCFESTAWVAKRYRSPDNSFHWFRVSLPSFPRGIVVSDCRMCFVPTGFPEIMGTSLHVTSSARYETSTMIIFHAIRSDYVFSRQRSKNTCVCNGEVEHRFRKLTGGKGPDIVSLGYIHRQTPILSIITVQRNATEANMPHRKPR